MTGVGETLKLKGVRLKSLGFTNHHPRKRFIKKLSHDKRGKLEGVVSLNGQKLDLSALTKESNTSEENTDAIIQAINAKEALECVQKRRSASL